MKAWVLHSINDFRLETVEMPKLERNEVLVAVKAAGICGSDIPRVYRTGAYSYPLILGHECSGIVEKVGEEADKKWQGKRVAIFPLIPCRSCIPCQKKQYEMCRNYSYLGSRRNGGFAEYMAVPQENLLELPETVSYKEAAMMEPMAVAVHAIRRILSIPAEQIIENRIGYAHFDIDGITEYNRITEHNTEAIKINNCVVIYGLGTIGMLLLQFLMDISIRNVFFDRILVIGNKDFQKQLVLNMGLPKDCYCDSKTENVSKWILERTEGMGADFIFECVGKNEIFAQAVDLAAPFGRICLVGNPYSDMVLEKTVYWKILRNQLTVTGTWNSSFTHQSEDDWHYVLDRLIQKKITPTKLISHQLTLEELEKGLQIMRDKTEDYMKIMINLK